MGIDRRPTVRPQRNAPALKRIFQLGRNAKFRTLPTGLAVGLGLESTLDRAPILRPERAITPAQWFPRSRFHGIWRIYRLFIVVSARGSASNRLAGLASRLIWTTETAAPPRLWPVSRPCHRLTAGLPNRRGPVGLPVAGSTTLPNFLSGPDTVSEHEAGLRAGSIPVRCRLPANPGD